MPRQKPNAFQNLLSSVVLSAVSALCIPISLGLIAACVILDRFRTKEAVKAAAVGCVIVSGGRMSKGLTLARAFKRAGWRVIGVEEEGWGELCPMRFSKAVDAFHILPAAAKSYDAYRDALISIAQREQATLLIPVSGAGSSVEDARAAEMTSKATEGRCRTFIQDPETMLDLHEKDRFSALVEKLGMTVPSGQLISSVQEGVSFLEAQGKEPRFILKCLALDENRGDMTLFPFAGDDDLSQTRRVLKSLAVPITATCPYVFQEFIPGPEWCTHASVVEGRLTSFVACPSNDMLMTYDNGTHDIIGRRAEEWTRGFLQRLGNDLTPSKQRRRLTGHFAFDFIVSSKDGQLYPLECNARVHTAITLLPVSKIASCYLIETASSTLRPDADTAPRSWLFNDIIMRYLPRIAPLSVLAAIHPSLPAGRIPEPQRSELRPREDALRWRVDPTLVANDWVPFLVLWHVYWPSLLLQRWWRGQRWTRVSAYVVPLTIGQCQHRKDLRGVRS